MYRVIQGVYKVVPGVYKLIPGVYKVIRGGYKVIPGVYKVATNLISFPTLPFFSLISFFPFPFPSYFLLFHFRIPFPLPFPFFSPRLAFPFPSPFSFLLIIKNYKRGTTLLPTSLPRLLFFLPGFSSSPTSRFYSPPPSSGKGNYSP